MSNVLAGIGRGQLEVLNDRVNARRSNFQKYKKFFLKYNNSGFNIKFQEEPEGYYSNRWLTCILVDPLFNNAVDGLMYIKIADLPESTVRPVMEEFQAKMERKFFEQNENQDK